MVYTTPVLNYVRAQLPASAQSQILFFNEELKKIERALQTHSVALAQIATKVP
jgi:hypothetical protein